MIAVENQPRPMTAPWRYTPTRFRASTMQAGRISRTKLRPVSGVFRRSNGDMWHSHRRLPLFLEQALPVFRHQSCQPELFVSGPFVLRGGDSLMYCPAASSQPAGARWIRRRCRQNSWNSSATLGAHHTWVSDERNAWAAQAWVVCVTAQSSVLRTRSTGVQLHAVQGTPRAVRWAPRC